MTAMAWYDFLSRLTEKAGGTGKLVLIIVILGIVLALLINIGYVKARRKSRFLQELDEKPARDREPEDRNGGEDE